MFSQTQKQDIAAVVERLLLSLHHPEMPLQKPTFSLHVDGKEAWSWAVIKPNWMFDEINPPEVNPHNEAQEARMEGKTYLGDAVYVCIENGMVNLTTEDGIRATNTIHMDEQVVADFLAWAKVNVK